MFRVKDTEDMYLPVPKLLYTVIVIKFACGIIYFFKKKAIIENQKMGFF